MKVTITDIPKCFLCGTTDSECIIKAENGQEVFVCLICYSGLQGIFEILGIEIKEGE